MRIQWKLLMLLMLLVGDSLPAQIPQLINYQGRLTNKDGTPATGTYEMQFKIYSDTTSLIPIWGEKQNIVVTNGIFNVLLGSENTFRDTLFASAGERYLGIQVGADAEMKPRFRLTSVPYAMQALYPKMQAGSWSTNIPYLGVVEGRTKTQVVNLSGFSKPPTVISFLISIDANTTVAFLRVSPHVANIEKDKFTLAVFTWADTHIYGVRVGWIAFGY